MILLFIFHLLVLLLKMPFGIPRGNNIFYTMEMCQQQEKTESGSNEWMPTLFGCSLKLNAAKEKLRMMPDLGLILRHLRAPWWEVA